MKNNSNTPRFVKSPPYFALILMMAGLLSACGSDNAESEESSSVAVNENDAALAIIISENNLNVSPVLNRDIPNINSPIAQLGKKLFFSKSLGGSQDTACASCHHPMLGGADDLNLPIGVEAVNSNVLGLGRKNIAGIPLVPRNSPTIFNVALWDSSLFWDSRVESFSKEVGVNGSTSAISTPDSGYGVADLNAGANLVVAQALFPVTSTEEMRSEAFEHGSSNTAIRHHLASRIGDYGEGSQELFINFWLEEFQLAFDSDAGAEQLITFDNIAFAIGEYERSMVFVESPWQSYAEGDLSSLTEQQKQGALLFFNTPENGGAGCAACHNGPLLSDELHYTVAFPQIGTGKGAGVYGDDDIGRGAVTGMVENNYQFRTPTLLNIAQTQPYGHAGTYDTLAQVIKHHVNAEVTANNYVSNQQWCQSEQFKDVVNCRDLYANASENTQAAIMKLNQEIAAGTSKLAQMSLSDEEVEQLVAFLESLTDPCIENRECMLPWIADPVTDNPDDNVLIAIDINAELL